jgi:histone arginine demethylase JMJD6
MSVERRSQLSLAEFRDAYMRAGQPVVIDDATDDWPAMTTWTPDYFEERFGDKEVTVDGTTFRLAEFVDIVRWSREDQPAPYLSNLVIRRRFPELLPDVAPGIRYAFPNPRTDWLIRKVGYETGVDNVEFYLGGRGTRFSTLHFDNFYQHAFITQVYGDKEFLLIPPDQTPYVYAGGELPPGHNAKTMRLDRTVAYHSSIDDIFDPDLDRFPLFRNATPMRITVSAPSTVFIPAGWWHATRMTSVSIAVSTNTLNSDNARRMRQTYDFPKRHSVRRSMIDRCGRPLVAPAAHASEWLAIRAGRSKSREAGTA